MFLIFQASSDRNSAGLPCARRETPVLSPSTGIDPRRDALLSVREHLYHAVVDEYPELKRFVRIETDRRRLGSA